MKHLPTFEEFVNESVTSFSTSIEINTELERAGFENIPFKEIAKYNFTTSGDIADSYLSSEKAWIHPDNPKYGIVFTRLQRFGTKWTESRNSYTGFSVVDTEAKESVYEKDPPKTFGPKSEDNFVKALNSIIEKIIKRKKI